MRLVNVMTKKSCPIQRIEVFTKTVGVELAAGGITISRQTLTNLVARAADLLAPVYYAQLSSILQSKVLAMDETPIKAGQSGKGKLHQGFFWPLYGDKDEVAFPYGATRALTQAQEILGRRCGSGLLLII